MEQSLTVMLLINKSVGVSLPVCVIRHTVQHIHTHTCQATFIRNAERAGINLPKHTQEVKKKKKSKIKGWYTFSDATEDIANGFKAVNADVAAVLA